MTLALTRANVVDVEKGTVLPEVTVLVDGDRIAGVGEVQIPRDAMVLDLAGSYLLPGLTTVHTHLSIVFPFADTDEDEPEALTAYRSAARASAALDAGATTIRCIHEQHRADLSLREAARRGWIRAPRILAGGRALSAPGGHGQGTGSVYCTGPAEYYAAAATELDAGADHVKIFITGGLAHAGEYPDVPEMTPQEMQAVVRAAESRGAYVVAHAGHFEPIRQALDAGVRSFEHAYHVDEATAVLLAAPDVFVSPTLLVTHSQATMRANGFEAHSMANAAAAAPLHDASMANLIAAGVTFTHGTDYPPGQIVEGIAAVVAEAELMQAAGLSPLQALRAATVNGARLCRIEAETGAVRPGLAADLLVTADNPLADIAALRTIDTVIAAGEIVRTTRKAVPHVL